MTYFKKFPPEENQRQISSSFVAVHTPGKQQRILPMLRISNRQNLLPPLYHTAFSIQKMPTRVQ